MNDPVFRFAPSPNGLMHLGHAYSALLNQKLARAAGAKLLLRIEDIDISRCTPGFEAMMLEDLEWIGFEWDGEPRRQSRHFDFYREALDRLTGEGLVYPSLMSRGQIGAAVAKLKSAGIAWPDDPDGAPVYPGSERDLPANEKSRILNGSRQYSLSLDCARAIHRTGMSLTWRETGLSCSGEEKFITADLSAWGDVILGRKDVAANYHLACVMDDALQGVTHIVRGRDLFQATAIHRTLQVLLGLAEPVYHHHELILDEAGKKLSKSIKSTALRHLRAAGIAREKIWEMFGVAG